VANTILVVDDEKNIVQLARLYLGNEGFHVEAAFDGAQAIEKARSVRPDLIVLEIMMPEMDGLSVCRELRKTSNVPIIILTARGDDVDRVVGLEIGADDYILKPFSPRQLVARIQAVLRRGRAGEPTPGPAKITIDGLSFNPRLREVYLSDGTMKSLTSLESQLLENLMLNTGHVLTIDDLISDVWGVHGGSAEMLRQLVRRLRTKIERDPSEPYYITNHPGIGYAFRLKR
jgi:two-component system response regulator ResD